MKLPFTIDQFFAVFAEYNLSVWPAQTGLLVLAVLALLLPFGKIPRDRWITGILAILWSWMGIVYHWIHFTGINKAAYAFGALFVLQGILFLLAGQRARLAFKRPVGLRGTFGTLLVIYALVVYPVLGAALGHIYPNAPTFGLPCPTTIFTFGLLLWADKGAPWWVLPVPLLWSLIGTLASLKLGVHEDFGLLVAGVIGAVFASGRASKTLRAAR